MREPAGPSTHSSYTQATQKTAIMGILNVTRDSFSDGGLYYDYEAAYKHAQELLRDGADLIDIGGESTRPGAQRVTETEELDQVIPLVQALGAVRGGLGKQGEEGAQEYGISVDTMRASVAAAAAKAGATHLNDVSGGLADPEMYSVAAQTGLPIILMHWRTAERFHGEFGNASGLAHHPHTVVEDVYRELSTIVDKATAAGIAEDKIILDPGLGFAKDEACNWALLRGLDRIKALGFPLLIGHSRKRFMQACLPSSVTTERASIADYPTTAVNTLMMEHKVWALRVHNVRAAYATREVISRYHAAEHHGI